MAKTYTAFTFDLTKTFTPMAEGFHIPDGLKVNIDVTLEDAAYKQLASDPSWIQKVADACRKDLAASIGTMKEMFTKSAKELKSIDAPNAQDAVDNITAAMAKKLQEFADHIGTTAATSIVKLFENYKQGKKELSKFRITCAKKIVFNTIVIGAATGIAAASHAVLAPPAIIQIVRSAADLAHQCVKLATPAQGAAQMVYAEIKVLDKLLVDGKTKKGMAVTLEAASSLLGLPLPSISLLVEHIKLHEVKIVELEKVSHQLGKTVYDAMDREEKYATKLESSDLSAVKKKTIQAKLATVQKALATILEANISVNKAVDLAKQRHPKFVQAYRDLVKGTPGCLEYIKPLMDGAIDMVLACSGAATALDVAVGMVTSLETTAVANSI